MWVTCITCRSCVSCNTLTWKPSRWILTSSINTWIRVAVSRKNKIFVTKLNAEIICFISCLIRAHLRSTFLLAWIFGSKLVLMSITEILLFYQSINQSINQSSKQASNPASQPASQPSFNQSINQSINQSFNQSINQSINQSSKQASKQAINQSIDQLLCKCMLCVVNLNSLSSVSTIVSSHVTLKHFDLVPKTMAI